MCLTPFSSSGGPNGPTERAQIEYCLMEIDVTVDGGGHILRTTRCCCAVACAKGYHHHHHHYISDLDLNISPFQGGSVVRRSLGSRRLVSLSPVA